MAPSHQQYFTARCAMASSHLQYFTCRFAMAPSHLQNFTATCAMAPSHLQIFHLQYWNGTFSPAILYRQICDGTFSPAIFYRQICDGTFSPAIFYLQICDGTFSPAIFYRQICDGRHLLTLKMFSTGRFAIAPSHLKKSFYRQSCNGIFSPWNFFPADLARRLLTCNFFHLQIWHGTFQGCQMHRKTKMIKPKFKSKLKSSKQPRNPLRPKPKYQNPSKTSKLCWKPRNCVKITQKKNRNALQPNCTTINAIIVTNTTQYGSIHRSCTLHHKPLCKNTENFFCAPRC